MIISVGLSSDFVLKPVLVKDEDSKGFALSPSGPTRKTSDELKSDKNFR